MADRPTCIQCGRPLALQVGEIYPLWVISGEVVGVFCQGCLLPEGRQQLADFRAGRLRLPDEHVQS